MRAALSTLEVVRPSGLDRALAALHDSLASERLTPLAGGTDLFVYLNAGTHSGTRFLDVSALRELRGIRVTKASVKIGGGVTFREIREHADLNKRLPSLVAAAAEVGAWQIQNRATLAGNVANASPAGDSLPVLLAHDAIVHARSVRGARGIPFAELYRGYRDLALEADELIVGLEIPWPAPRAFSFFRKVGTRRAQSISKVVLSGVLEQDTRGVVTHARLAWGSVAPVTLRSRTAEAALIGQKPSAAVTESARRALLDDIAPIDDIRSEREYRVAVAGNVLEQMLRAADARFAKD
ncbi:MAG TPA: FAD binding domain-containing protein [Candidatus Saccharimonadaceae bacterium]|nr:FAD binding domain-containing protein [Candidatus Saccharimonadaceae bacterium]